MKKILLLLSLFILSGCNLNNTSQDLKIPEKPIATEKEPFYLAKNVFDDQKYYGSYKTENYDYHYFYIGDIVSSPIRKSPIYRCTEQELSYNMSFSTSTVKEISSSVSTATTIIKEHVNTRNNHITVGVEVGKDITAEEIKKFLEENL